MGCSFIRPSESKRHNAPVPNPVYCLDNILDITVFVAQKPQFPVRMILYMSDFFSSKYDMIPVIMTYSRSDSFELSFYTLQQFSVCTY